MNKILLILLLHCIAGVLASAQSPYSDISSISVLSFEEFQPLLNQSDDTTYLVNFWATWCVPCRKEMPELERINKDLQKDKVKVILTSLDFPEKIESGLIPYLQKSNIQSTVVLLDAPDPNSWIDKVHPSWSGAIPATLLYKGDKKIFMEKQITYEEIKEIINSKF